MDPRTFAKPQVLPVAPVPAVGESAPTPPGPPFEAGGQVIAFLRHAGCPFAEATFRALRDQSAKHPTVTAVAVGHAPPSPATLWRSKIGGSEGVVCVDDPSRHTYAQWGLGITDLSHFAGADSLTALVSLAGRGIRNRHPSGSRWQGAGTFAVDGHGIVRFVHIACHAGDLPDLVAAFRALEAR